MSMRHVAIGLLASLSLGCQASPVYAPFGSQLFLDLETIETEPGVVGYIETLVVDGDGAKALNNVYVEFFALGAMTLLPPEAIVGTSNQQVDSNGDGVPDTSATEWCEAYSGDEQAYQECFNEYFFDILDLQAPISPDFARVPTDDRGVVRIYWIAFCEFFNGNPICADGSEDLDAAISVSIGVDATSVTFSYTSQN